MKRVALTSLQGKTLDIINTIRANASAEYQSLVPQITALSEVPKVGEVIYGSPAVMNQFLSALMNRIALVQMYSADFNNDFNKFKKGMLEYGETVEEVFTEIINVQAFDVEKAPARELKRHLPKVHTAFHIMNWRVVYPLTVQKEDLKQAFLSAERLEQFIMRLIDQQYTAVQYDDYLLTKYLLIKAISSGSMEVKKFGSGDLKNAAIAFRATAGDFTFMSNKHNNYGVRTTTPRDRQYIIMDNAFNAAYDVNVLSEAFNMDKATYTAKLTLIDDFTTFDNERWDAIRAESDMIEEVTAEELAACANVKAVLLDSNWYQIYDNEFTMREKEVASGLYWNYFLHSWKTISFSPFANAVAFVDDSADTTLPDSLTAVITGKTVNDVATLFTIDADIDDIGLVGGNVNFVQTETATRNGIAISPKGAVMIPANNLTELTLQAELNGTIYNATTTISSAQAVGAQVTLSKVSAAALSLDEE